MTVIKHIERNKRPMGAMLGGMHLLPLLTGRQRG